MELLSAKEVGLALGCTDRAVRNWVKQGELRPSAVGKSSQNKPVELYCLEQAKAARQRLLERKADASARTLDKVRKVNPPATHIRTCGFDRVAKTKSTASSDLRGDALRLNKELRALWRMVNGSQR